MCSQSLFTLGAEKINQGGILYKDFWDLKPLGTFLFYLAGGKLFGFDEIGIHLFELLYMLALAFTLIVTLQNYFQNPFASGLQFFIDKFAVPMALGTLGMVGSPRRRHDPMTRFLFVWWAAGLGSIFLQTLSWWDYHYLLLFVPLGILAAKGLDTLWVQMNPLVGSLDSRKRIAFGSLSLVLLFSPALLLLVDKSLRLVRADLAFTIDQQVGFRCKYSLDYKEALEEVAFLKKPKALPGDIYVFGDPSLIYLSGRGQAISLHGHSINIPGYLPEQWAELQQTLSDAMPPYIFVEADKRDLVQRKSPGVMAFIDRNYAVSRRSKMGVWYELIPSRQPQRPDTFGP